MNSTPFHCPFCGKPESSFDGVHPCKACVEVEQQLLEWQQQEEAIAQLNADDEQREQQEWSAFSLASAFRGMEDE